MPFERTRLPLRGRIASALCAMALVCVSAPALAQAAASPSVDPALRFEVVSIRPHNADDHSSSIRMTEDGYFGVGINIGGLVRSVYNADDWWDMDDVPGLPSSLRSARYDIQAKIDPDTAARLKALKREDREPQLNLMLRAMLEDRFHLQVHNVMKDAPMYSLVVARGGLKMKESAPPQPDPDASKGQQSPHRMMRVGMGEMTASAVGLDQLASNLGGQVHRKVINDTGIKGQYDFTLKWNWHEQFGEKDSGSAVDSLPTLYTALEEQLGLELKATHGQVKSVVVDHIEPPSEN